MSIELFKQTEEKYLQLKNELATGQLALNRFDLAMKRTKIKDPIGRPWLIDAEKGKWYVYDGQAWVPADPYRTLRRMTLVPEPPQQRPLCTILGIHAYPPSKSRKIWRPAPPLRSGIELEGTPSTTARKSLPAWLKHGLKKRQERDEESSHLNSLPLATLLLLAWLCMLVLLSGLLAMRQAFLHSGLTTVLFAFFGH